MVFKTMRVKEIGQKEKMVQTEAQGALNTYQGRWRRRWP